MAGGVAEFTFVFENDEGSGGHAACGAGGGLVELEGVFEGGEKKFEVVIGEAGLFGEEGVNETLSLVEAVGDGEFSAHGAFFFDVFFFCDRRACDGVFAGDDGINGAGERNLDGASDLAAVDVRGHDRTKGPDIVEVLAHPSFGFLLGVHLWLFHLLFGDFIFSDFSVGTKGFVGFFVLVVVDGEFFEVDIVICGLRDEIANFAFDADIGDEALASFRVNAGEVACIGIAVGVGVLGVEEEEEVVSVIHGIFVLVDD